jgi:hypothetical protein
MIGKSADGKTTEEIEIIRQRAITMAQKAAQQTLKSEFEKLLPSAVLKRTRAASNHLQIPTQEDDLLFMS